MSEGQSVDPTVSRTKFYREIAEYREAEDVYRKRGWLLIRADFPITEVVLTAPQLKPPAVVTGVRFDYTNYDARPPSVRLVDPFTGDPYRPEQLPTQLFRAPPAPISFDPGGLADGMRMQLQQPPQPLMQSFGPDDIPFLCLAGVREYHDHPGHSGDPWELHRVDGAGRLVRLLEIIDHYGVQPLNGYSISLVPQIAGFAQSPPPA